MTQENKELLLKDLCVRMPYGVICHYNCVIRCDIMEIKKANCVGKLEGIIPVNDHIGFMVGGDRVNALFDDIKPYLRPMSSMTEEEIKECYQLQQDTVHVTFYEYDEGYEKTIDLPYFGSLVDFYNSHHLDYRGLIPMGLALEAPEGMYN